MKIFIISEMTIYPELKKLCEKNSIQIEKKLALKIMPVDYDISELDSMIYSADGLIFQSKNAVSYCKENYMAIRKRVELNEKQKTKNNALKIYSTGKYSAENIKKLIGVKSEYNDNDFSSEGLLETIKDNCESGDTFVVIKGMGGRNYTEEELKKKNVFVKSYSVYDRESAGICIKNDNLVPDTNYFIITSLTALEILQDSLENISTNKVKIAIVPTKRIAARIKDAIFDHSIIISNSATAEQYIREIVKNEKE